MPTMSMFQSLGRDSVGFSAGKDREGAEGIISGFNPSVGIRWGLAAWADAWRHVFLCRFNPSVGIRWGLAP